MVTTIPFFQEAFTFDEATLTPPILKASISRQVFPFDTSAKIEDLRYEYFTEVQDINNKYSFEQTETPESSIVLQRTPDTIPIIHGAIAWTRHELKRVDRSKMPVAQRIASWAASFAIDEDRILFGVSDPITSKTGVINTTNHSTAVTTELNVTTIALAHSSLMAQIQELQSNPGSATTGIRYRIGSDPLLLIVTTDVFNKAANVLSTVNERFTVLDTLQGLLDKFGGPGSTIFATDDLGATITKTTTDRYNTAAGTTNSLLKAVNSNYSKVIASPFEIFTETPEGGLKRVMSERLVLNTKELKASRYGATAVIA